MKFTRGLPLLAFLFLTSVGASAQPATTAPEVAPAVQVAWPIKGEGLTPSSRVTWGTLDNGFRYALLPNKTPAGQVSIRLFVDAGSIHERDDERGYAHFVEHMAFNGTTNFAAGAFVKLLQHQGATMGAHINAFTTQERTTYKFDLPGSEAALTTGLRVFRDFADGILFDPGEVDRERRVIASEDLARTSPQRRAAEAWAKIYLAGTRADRSPIGTPESIKSADAAGLRAFYDAWYRPERMVLVVVGTMDLSRTEQFIREQFSSLASRAPLRAEPDFGQIATPEKPQLTLYRNTHSGVDFTLSHLSQETRPADSLRRREDQNAFRIAHAMIARRVTRLREQPKAKITSSALHDEWFVQRVRRVAISVGSSIKNWEAALATAEQELRRAIDQGFHETELAEIKTAELAGIRHAAGTVDTVNSRFLADQLVNDAAYGTVFMFPDERQEMHLGMYDRLTVARCQEALRDAWGTLPPKWVYVSADSGFREPSAKILTAYNKSAGRNAKQAQAIKTIDFAYDQFGPIGKVVRKEYIEDIDTWQVEFENGVHLNLKKTSFEKDSVDITVRVGTGILEEPRQQPGLRHWIQGVFIGGLGKHTADEVRRTINGRLVRLTLLINDSAFVFKGGAISKDLPFALRLVTADIIDPAFRKDAQPKIQSHLSSVYDPLRESPEKPRLESLWPFLAGNDSRFTFPPRSRVSAYSFKDVRAWLKPQFDRGYLECTLVGDIDIEATIAEVAKTLGATPRRAAAKPAMIEARKLNTPAAPASRTYTFASASRPATLEFHWPVRSLETGQELIRLSLLMEILEERAKEKIREELGETYLVSAGASWNRTFSALSSLRCGLDVKRDKVDDVIEHFRAVVAELVEKGVNEDELTRARAQFLKGTAQAKLTNGYWLNALDDIQSDPVSLELIRQRVPWIENATAGDLNALAARYLHPGNLLQFTLSPVVP